jgi:hypothetical protein
MQEHGFLVNTPAAIFIYVLNAVLPLLKSSHTTSVTKRICFLFSIGSSVVVVCGFGNHCAFRCSIIFRLIVVFKWKYFRVNLKADTKK